MFRPYPKTKYSGVEWLCKVPEHWGIKPLKHVVGLINEKAETTDGEYIGLENIESFTGRLTPSSSEVDKEGTANLFRAADVLFGKLRPYLAKAIIAKVDGRCSSELLVLRPLGTIPSFLHYQVLSDHFIRIVDSSTYGTKMPRANWDFIGKMPVPVPDLAEQRAIASFLDHKTALIDGLIAKRERQIELLQEQRTTLITRAVTKGLNPDVPMKDSGVEWLGKVPGHWAVKALKWESPVFRGASPRPIDNPIYFDEQGEYAWVRISDVTSAGMYLDATEQRLSDLGSSLSVKLVPGRIFLSIAGSVGKPCITRIKCCIHDGFVYFPMWKGNTKFLYYVFASGEPYKGLGKMGTQLNLNTDTVGAIVLGVPCVEEQDEIADYLDRETAKVDAFVSKVQQGIEKLREYRLSLISAAVTGKIDVRGHAASATSLEVPA